MAHISALLRNEYSGAMRRKIAAQVTVPLTLLSEIYFPASSAAVPTYNTGYNKRRLRHTRVDGANHDSPVLCVAFSTSVYMGHPEYGVRHKDKQARLDYIKEYSKAAELARDIVTDLASQNVLARDFCKSEATDAGHIWQFGVAMPIQRPYWHSKGRYYVEPNSDQLAVFCKYLTEHQYISESDAEPVFSARVRYLAQQL